MGFQNEKDHPEVAPSQFEINYGYGEVVAAADQIQLYKLICRQVATNMGLTASFLPKPVVGVNGSGMHTNVSISEDGKNLFWDAKGEEKLSKMGWAFLDRILTHGNDICLLLNPSVNAYRRLDPHFEAPNQIKASAVDRGSMIRIPIGNEKSMRVEVRSVAPDANPYLVMLAIFKSGIDGETSKIKNLRQAERYLPDNIYDALADFRKAEWTTNLLGEDVKGRYADLKQAACGPLPASAGNVCESAGGAVSPRRLQPVPLESVLEHGSSAAKNAARPQLLRTGYTSLIDSFSKVAETSLNDYDRLALAIDRRTRCLLSTLGGSGVTGFQTRCCRPRSRCAAAVVLRFSYCSRAPRREGEMDNTEPTWPDTMLGPFGTVARMFGAAYADSGSSSIGVTCTVQPSLKCMRLAVRCLQRDASQGRNT